MWIGLEGQTTQLCEILLYVLTPFLASDSFCEPVPLCLITSLGYVAACVKLISDLASCIQARTLVYMLNQV